MKRPVKIAILALPVLFICYLISFTVADAFIMGPATPDFDFRLDRDSYTLPRSARIDPQTEFRCSAFSSAYILRQKGIEAHGDSIYEIMPSKMENGYVYPKGIISFLKSEGVAVRYRIGNLTALKNEVAKGHPVIVMIKVRPDRDWLHYVPVVGYTPDSIFVAESLPALVNTGGPLYNRSISTAEFITLWNATTFRTPLYRNTFITSE